jgi:hypothetical protein
MVIQAASANAIQSQVEAAITSKVPAPPAAMKNTSCAESVAVQSDRPACVTANGWPATVIDAVRAAAPGFVATLKATVPPPEPEAPEVTISHAADTVAVQAQPPGAATVNEDTPPAAPNDAPAGERRQPHACPCCVTVTVWLATVSVPARLPLSDAAATVKVNVPGPVRAVPLAAVIHGTFERASQAHAPAVDTATDPVPPAALIDREVEESEKVQVAGVGWAGFESQPAIRTAHAATSAQARMAGDPCREQYNLRPAGCALSSQCQRVDRACPELAGAIDE